MTPVRLLSELARTMNEAAFAKQVGPFALMQREARESRVEESNKLGAGSTALQPAVKLKPVGSVVDFGDLIVATLPPPLPDGQLELVIGRAPDCDLVIEDAAISKRHAVIRWNGSEAVISELGSANGTFINGHKMKEQWTLRNADQVRLGESTFTFLLAKELYARVKRSGV